MKSLSSFILIFLFPVLSFAGNSETKTDTFPNFGNEIKESRFFRERVQYNDFVHYLDNLNDFVTYQSETTGQFNLPEMMIFSISGNSYKWNKYYLDGFRLDNRFTPGSTFYQPDLYTHSVNIDYYRSGVSFRTDSIIPNTFSLKYNVGGLGGISAGTKNLINLFHLSASERLYKPILYRNKIKDAVNVSMNYSIPVNGKLYAQQFSADVGTRMIVDFDETGINNYYPEDFYKVQLSGQLPIKKNKLFDKTNYLFNSSYRQNLYNEFYFSKDESAENSAYSFSIYGSKNNSESKYTTGLTLATNNVQHNNLNFSRNLIDQDGEAFEPWYPDGNTSELSYALNYNKNLSHFLKLTFDGYNSLINFTPGEQSFQNAIFARNVNLSYRSLYVYNWTSGAYTGGLMENTLGLKANKKLGNRLNFKANFDLTLDGMLLSEKSMVRANWQAQMGFYYHPAKWFSMEFNLSRNRINFNLDDIRYFSNDYLNGEIYYWKDTNNDQNFQQQEQSDYFTSTGGKYHTAIENLKQPTSFTLDLPFYFRFGNHQISLLNTYSKYNNFWNTQFDKPADQYGKYQTEGDQEIFFLNNGTVNYKVGYYDASIMKSDGPLNFLSNSPFYFSSVVKYQYTNEKFLFSFSWCSYIMTGISTLGNGPHHNNIGVYSETSANPNINYKLLGRLDQERAYVCRIFTSYNVNNHLSFAFNGKFKDGQPFTDFKTLTITDNNGNNQMAIWANRTKGINPLTGDFGSREDACFNIDLSATYKGKIMNHNFDLQAMVYNLYDFGTELTEYTFQPDNIFSRYAMSLNIPRGLMLTAKIYL
ncbi:MAG TPA: hypothetical protein P5084_05275 [Paludibacter sp.]|nr:hypothetical protein [Paludibacter sp.]